MSTRLHIVVSEELLARIDGAKGEGQPRADFIRRAVDAELERRGFRDPERPRPMEEVFGDAAAGAGRYYRQHLPGRAVEQALGGEREGDGNPVVGANSSESERLASTPERAEHRPGPAPAEQLGVALPAERWRAARSSSLSKRDVRPIPKGKP